MGCSRYLVEDFRVPQPAPSTFQNADPRERVELYEAAQVIQQAFRHYRKRQRILRQLAEERQHRQAAVVIQSYFRRYRQYCYFKKVQKAAIIIQKYYRKHRAQELAAALGQKEADAKEAAKNGQSQEGNSAKEGNQISKADAEEIQKKIEILENIEQHAAKVIQKAFRKFCKEMRSVSPKSPSSSVSEEKIFAPENEKKRSSDDAESGEPSSKRARVE